ncbi:hypothetical protein HP15_3577 [Marinobacter adhaerens HP15]|uniref:Uncharacterized protein n=1 Tax=Marinobacter adhaerens (strain DSM 23420 / HP15) TaxID=225937 RepID=E4PGN2_MARAH|nr:hypothetical protein HP15_3577 [Marinobacter adhaerens HP15]
MTSLKMAGWINQWSLHTRFLTILFITAINLYISRPEPLQLPEL